jgi:hypothetical protein
MKSLDLRRALVLALMSAAAAADEHARGVQLMAEGKFADAVTAFRAAAEADPKNAELQYNLALALWRAGDATAAEIAAEKAATLSDGRLASLRDGIHGNLKIDEAQHKLGGEQPDLQGALSAAQKARDHFVHGAAMRGAPAELTRNLERALALIADIEKKIEEQKQEQKDDDKDKQEQENKDDKSESKDGKDGKDDKQQDKPEDKEKKDEQQPPDDKKQDDKEQDDKKQDDKKQDDKQEQPQGQGENKDKPEPKAEPEPKDGKEEPKPQEQSKDDKVPQPQPGEQQDKPEPQPAPGDEDKDKKPDDKAIPLGQPQEGRELSPEETKRLLDKLQAVLELKAEMEKANKAARPKVKKDW